MAGLDGLAGDFVVPVGAVVEATEGEFDVCQIAFHGVEVKWAFWIHELQRRRGSTGDAKEAVRDARCSLACMSLPFPALDGSAPKTQKFPEAPEMGIDPSKRYTATMETTLGTIVIALDAINAPRTVNNFVYLAGYHYYDGIIFHRIINGFMCQGGDPTGTGTGGPGYRFGDELPKPGQYQIGSVAMANAGPNTNGSQFFIVSGGSGVSLPPAYALFGQVVKGLDVVDAMQKVQTARGDRPVEDVVINSVTITVAD